jgi:hypothetical protein
MVGAEPAKHAFLESGFDDLHLLERRIPLAEALMSEAQAVLISRIEQYPNIGGKASSPMPNQAMGPSIRVKSL